MKKRVWALLCCLLLMLPTSVGGRMPGDGAWQAGSAQGQWKESDAASVAAVRMIENEKNATEDAVTAGVVLDTPTAGTAEVTSVLLGGMPFGVKFFTEGVTVVGFGEVETAAGSVNPASRAGLRIKDVILSVDGKELSSAADLTERIEGSEGREMTLVCRRGGKSFSVKLTPVYSSAEGRYKTGIWVRDSGAGIGTVTFVLPEDGRFAGLGHGICDADTGELIAMRRGVVADVTISAVVRGAAGAPGELKGYFNAGKTGALVGNTACGVWGIFSEIPKDCTETVAVGRREELTEGEAELLCTLDSNRIGRYRIEIKDIKRDCDGSKCFTVHVTDPALIERTGGIVQGMSGSPIIQNGKLVGAVTHVLINDPTTGYGIFIENMLNAVQMPMARAS